MINDIVRQDFLDSHILIVDDQDANILLLERLLARAGFTNILSTTDPRQVLLICISTPPDLILLDLHMPHFDGFATLEQLRSWIPDDEYVPIIVLTADISPAAKQRALGSGAKDFLTKPFDPAEVLLRINNLLETKSLHRQIMIQNDNLEEAVRARTQDLEAAKLEILERLALAAEYRDDTTGHHIHRVSKLSALIARALDMPNSAVSLIGQAAPLHDVGKIGIPDSILLKPGALTTSEIAQMRTHTTIGAKILAHSHFAILQTAERIALCHHERWNGAGYPQGLSGEDIPLEARIVAVADVFDALTHARPYKVAWTTEQAIEELVSQSGQHFDPDVIAAFLQVCHDMQIAEAGVRHQESERISA